VNKPTLIKFSFVFVTTATILMAGVSQSAIARETATVPIVKTSGDTSLGTVKDSGTTPIVAIPSQTDVTAKPTGEPTDDTVSVTITVNVAPTTDTILSIETSHPDALSFPATVTLPAGSTSVTATGVIVPGDYKHHKNVKIEVTANGTTVQTKVKVHYVSEQD
jgi:hypothetical protein